ncbi:MAG: LpxI family protein [Planctomycetota bacterium]
MSAAARGSAHDDRPVGLIAGQGALPILVAQGIRAAGRRVACIGLADQFAPELPALCDRFESAGVLRPGRWIRLARRFGIREAVMVGRVSKGRMHDPLRILRQIPDLRAINLWYRKLRHDRRSATLLTTLADDLAKEGLVLIDSTTYIPEHMAALGPMTRREPTEMQRSDIEFAWPILTQVGALDIGQAMAVREKDVIAVEAVEGTDRMIDRAGELCRRKGWTLVKTARPGHDMRADVPTIGVSTVERMHAAGGGCIAVGAGRVILVDRPAVLAAADRLGIAIIGVGDGA